MIPTFKVWTDDTDWYIAADLDDLACVIKEHNGCTYEEMVGEPVGECFRELDLNQRFQMNFPEEDLETAIRDSPPTALQYFSNAQNHPVMEDTFRAWVLHCGRGFLASTEY